MAHTKTGRAGHTTEHAASINPAGDSKPLAIDPESLLQLLEMHAARVGAAIGEVIVEKLALSKGRATEERSEPALAGSRESVERAEHALEAEEAWLTKHPADDRAHLKCTDHELRELEKTLEGPQKLLEQEQGDARPPVGKRGAWQLPEYQPVPPDVVAKEECDPVRPAGGA